MYLCHACVMCGVAGVARPVWSSSGLWVWVSRSLPLLGRRDCETVSVVRLCRLWRPSGCRRSALGVGSARAATLPMCSTACVLRARVARWSLFFFLGMAVDYSKAQHRDAEPDVYRQERAKGVGRRSCCLCRLLLAGSAYLARSTHLLLLGRRRTGAAGDETMGKAGERGAE